MEMKKTFREKVMQSFAVFAKKHRFLKYPGIVVMAMVLSLYYLCRHFATNGKRYAGIAFSLLFFISSCSFSFAVFTGQSGFVDAAQAYSEVVEYSDVELAVEKEVKPDEDMLSVYESELEEHGLSENDEDAASYTLEDILDNAEAYSEAEVTDGEETSLENEESKEQADNEAGADLDKKEADNSVSEEETPEFDSSDWRLVLVNKQHPIPEDYNFELGAIKGDMKCDERIIADLLSMLQAAKEDGINLAVRSPYRTRDRQEFLFGQKINRYMGQGYSYMEAYKTASQIVTIPGSSEHQIGLALDITSDSHVGLDEAFADTEAGKWLAENSCEYGFILRYPLGKEYITGIEFEPWHFRYVGKDAAVIIMKNNICLEEFWDKYM